MTVYRLLTAKGEENFSRATMHRLVELGVVKYYDSAQATKEINVLWYVKA